MTGAYDYQYAERQLQLNGLKFETYSSTSSTARGQNTAPALLIWKMRTTASAPILEIRTCVQVINACSSVRYSYWPF